MKTMDGNLERLEGCPDLLGLHALDDRRYPFFFESVGGASALGRFDILFAFPGETLTLPIDSPAMITRTRRSPRETVSVTNRAGVTGG